MSAAPCGVVNNTLRPVMVTELYRVALASVHALASTFSKPHSPHIQTVQWMFYLRIDSECMHGKRKLFKYLYLILDGDPEIYTEKSYCRPRLCKSKSGRAVVEGDES